MEPKNRNVLITGASGFVGKALVKKLTKKNEFSVFTIDKGEGDISTIDFNFQDIHHIVHLAARTYVPASWLDPISFYQTNVIGTLNVLEYCKKCGASATVLSSYVYGEPDFLPISEKHKRKPFNPYCHSKILMEDICSYYMDTYHVRVDILRPFNLYGPGQQETFLIPTIIKQVLSPQCREVTVMDLKPRRDFLYIDDLVNAIILSIANPSSKFLNVGSGTSYSVIEVIKNIMNLCGISKEVISNSNRRPNEVMDIVCDNSQLRESLGWSVKTSFEDGIKKTINYYSKN